MFWALSSLNLIESASSAVSKPTALEFTAKFVDASYDAPTTATNILEMFPWVLDSKANQWSSTQTVTTPTSDTAQKNTPSTIQTPNTQTNPDNAKVTDLIFIVIAASATIVIAVAFVATVLVRKAKNTDKIELFVYSATNCNSARINGYDYTYATAPFTITMENCLNGHVYQTYRQSETKTADVKVSTQIDL